MSGIEEGLPFCPRCMYETTEKSKFLATGDAYFYWTVAGYAHGRIHKFWLENNQRNALDIITGTYKRTRVFIPEDDFAYYNAGGSAEEILSGATSFTCGNCDVYIGTENVRDRVMFAMLKVSFLNVVKEDEMCFE